MKKDLWVVVLSIPLLLLILVFLILTGRAEENRSLADKLFFSLSSEEGIEKVIRCFENESGEIFVFLPSYAKHDTLTVDTIGKRPISIDGTEIRSGMDCSWIDLDTEYSITDGRDETTIRFLQSADVATMYIETESGTMDKIHKDKTHKEEAEILLFTKDGALDYRGDGIDQIRGHGNSTWELDKKPYNLYLSKKTDLLNLGQGAKWVLLSGGYDCTNIRNKLILDLADKTRSFEGFSPHTAYVDLYLNGEYAGLYLLAEHTSSFDNIEILSEYGILFYTDAYYDDEAVFFMNPEYWVMTVLPDPITESHCRELENAVKQFQEAVSSEDPEDTRWIDYIDIDSWARKYLIEEMFMNNDVGTSSMYYIWNDQKNIIYAGPCWDYDDTFGEYLRRSPRSFLANREWEQVGHYSPWFHWLMQKPEFIEKVTTLYRDIYSAELEWLYKDGIEEYADNIRQAALLNQIRWNLSDSEWELERMIKFLDERASFLDSAWIEGDVYHTVTMDGLRLYRFFSIPDGEDGAGLPSPAELPLPDHYNMTVEDTWYYEGTDEPFDPNAPITEDITLYAVSHIIENQVSSPKHGFKKQYVVFVTLFVMIIFLAAMMLTEFRRNCSGKRWCGHD